MQFIKANQGTFMRDENGVLQLLIGHQRTSLAYHRDNTDLANLMLKSCSMSILSSAAQAAIQRLVVEGNKNSSTMRFMRFSALSGDQANLYIPIAGGNLL